MKLYATPLSHFARKVRILLDLYSLPYEFIDVGNVVEGKPEKFGNNPLMKVPTLVDGDDWLIESDHISSYLVSKYDPTDKYHVNVNSVSDLNFRAVLNGIMNEEVKIILARRTQIPIEQYAFFDKALQSIVNGLNWLEENSAHFKGENPKYQEFHLVCLWDHLEYYGLVPLNYKKLQSVVAKISDQSIIKKTSPRILKPK